MTTEDTNTDAGSASALERDVRPCAWMHEDGRVVPAATIDAARRDGGAMLSSLRDYTVPLYADEPVRKLLADTGENMDFGRQIINLRCDVDANLPAGCGEAMAYKHGHRDARHAAAELASEHAELLEQYKAEVQKCFDLAQRMDALEPGVPGAFTGTPSERIARQLAVMRDEFVSG